MKCVITSAAFTIAMSTLGLGANVHATQDENMRVVRHELVWSGDNVVEDRTAMLLRIGFPQRPTVVTQRALLYDGETRLIATWSLDHRKGLEYLHLLDDQTGWWIQIQQELGVRTDPGEEYPVFTQRLEEWLRPGQGHEIEFRVTTSTGFIGERQIFVGPPAAELMRTLATELEADEDWQEAKGAIPPAVLAAAGGWQGLLYYESLVRLMITFLDEVAGGSEEVAAPRLTVSKSQTRRGTEPNSPRWQELLPTFDYFDADEPLPEDLFESAESP